MDKNKEKPKISIIMGIYNCAGTLPDAIESILAQTYGHWELILCDDCSTDDTYEVASRFQRSHPEKICLIKNNINSGLAYTLNHCLQFATGDYIARMDGDDISLPNRLKRQVEYLMENQDIDLVGTWMQRFDGNPGNLAKIITAQPAPDRYSLRHGVCFSHATIMARRHVYDQLGGYTVSERTMRGQDYDLWFRFFHKGFKGCNLQEVLYLVREDTAAIKRRSFKVRWNGFRTTVYGYRLLEYPKHWLVIAFMRTLVKSLTPYWLYSLCQRYKSKIKGR